MLHYALKICINLKLNNGFKMARLSHRYYKLVALNIMFVIFHDMNPSKIVLNHF